MREQDIQAALAWLHAGDDRHILALDDPRYPAALLDLPDAPLLVYARGSLAALQPAAVAIVGSRRASHEGLRNAQALAEALARRGIVVTSAWPKASMPRPTRGPWKAHQQARPAPSP